MAGDYSPPTVGARENGMEWTGLAWAVVCPACDTPMTGHEELFPGVSALCCTGCGVRAKDVRS